MVVLRALWNHCQMQSWVHCPFVIPLGCRLDWRSELLQITTHCDLPWYWHLSSWNLCSLSVESVGGGLSWCLIAVTQRLKIYLGDSCPTAKPRSGLKLQSFKYLSGTAGVGPVCYLVARELFCMLLLVFLKLAPKRCQKQDFTFLQGYPGLLCG